MDFNEIEWHDCVLRNIYIDRSNPGYQDIVKLSITTPDSKKLSITFEDVYHADLNLNFNVIAEETIRSAEINYSSDALKTIKEKWRQLSAEVSTLKQFEITTNSTNSTITVYALKCHIDHDDDLANA
ncbi:hypothetical protein [Mucilaginibacter boryungensis]|uniref:Uncharacterized protein n=1 Tax=Mucilaginibacter boryungensis TaxID=768480 RepID=A0ABR9XLJ6_9SPHI|nr:hypothetical protein [Mucilaginibacter boryungensis]MBE9668238.1 hypothetical protein [Mucilaginibacter boryungensis]